MRYLKSALLAAGLLGLTSAQAAVSIPVAQATLDWSSFSYQLFDLNPTDGVAASLTWLSQQSSTNAYDSYSNFVSDFAGDWTTSLTSAAGSLLANATPSGVSVISSGYQTDVNGAGAYRQGTFSLSPMTLVVFSINGAVSVIEDSNPDTTAFAAADLSVYGVNTAASNYSYSSLSTSTYDPVTNKSSLLATSFVNLSGSALSGQMYTSARAGATAPVPEPETYAMLLAGLAVMAQVARRRRAN